jgi:hypothetical protein
MSKKKEVAVCQQCFRDYTRGAHDDGFCSDFCLEAYEDSFEDEFDGEDDKVEEEE